MSGSEFYAERTVVPAARPCVTGRAESSAAIDLRPRLRDAGGGRGVRRCREHGVGGSACGLGTGMGLGLWSETATAGPAFQITLAE